MNLKRTMWIVWSVFLIAAAWFGFIRNVPDAHIVVVIYAWICLLGALCGLVETESESVKRARRAEYVWLPLNLAFDVALSAVLLMAGAWGYAAIYLISNLIMSGVCIEAREAA